MSDDLDKRLALVERLADLTTADEVASLEWDEMTEEERRNYPSRDAFMDECFSSDDRNASDSEALNRLIIQARDALNVPDKAALEFRTKGLPPPSRNRLCDVSTMVTLWNFPGNDEMRLTFSLADLEAAGLELRASSASNLAHLLSEAMGCDVTVETRQLDTYRRKEQ